MAEPINNLNVCTEQFNKVYDETFDEIKAFTAAKCADPTYVSDILQETYLEFFRQIMKNGADYAENPRAVLYKIAKRRVCRYYSLRQKLSALIPLFRANDEGEEYCTADDELSVDISDTILSEMEFERLWKIINTYPAEVRKIMYLYFNCGMSHSEIAERLGLSLSTVKNKLYRTLARIKEGENGNERK